MNKAPSAIVRGETYDGVPNLLVHRWDQSDVETD